MLARRGTQAVGNQDQRPIRQHPAVDWPPAAAALDDPLEAQLAPQRARHQHGPPIPRADRVHLPRAHSGARRVTAEQPGEAVEMRRQEIFAAQVADDALLVLAVFAIGLDESHIFVLASLATRRLDDAEIHRDLCHGNLGILAASVKHNHVIVCHYNISGRPPPRPGNRALTRGLQAQNSRRGETWARAAG